MSNIQRPHMIKFRVTEEEKEMIEKKAKLAGINNLSSYLRKIAIDGYVIKLDIAALRELTGALGRYSGNLNQIARRVNSSNRIYKEDIEEIQDDQKELWGMMNKILESLTSKL